jgi:outer membrane immunogenic protein
VVDFLSICNPVTTDSDPVSGLNADRAIALRGGHCERAIAYRCCFVALIAGPATAADLARPIYRAPVAVAVPFSWTGFYIGANIGAAFGIKEETFSLPAGAIVTNNQQLITGFLGGGQVGFNSQTGPVVWGVEWQFSWSDLDGKNNCNTVTVPLMNCEAKADWLTTLAGRIGFAAAERTLVFMKGGGAWVHDKYTDTSLFPPFNTVLASETRSGWMFGTGVEHAFYDNWSAKIEYDYMDFGTKTITFPGLGTISGGANETVDIKQSIHLVKFGINYRFGTYAPFVTK